MTEKGWAAVEQDSMFLLSFLRCTVFYIVVCRLQASSTSVFDHDDLAGDDTDDDDLAGEDVDDDDEADAAVVIYHNTWHPVLHLKIEMNFTDELKYLQMNTNANECIEIQTIATPDTYSVVRG